MAKQNNPRPATRPTTRPIEKGQDVNRGRTTPKPPIRPKQPSK